MKMGCKRWGQMKMAGHRFLKASFLIGEVTLRCIAKCCRLLQGRIGLATEDSKQVDYVYCGTVLLVVLSFGEAHTVQVV
jgi:hypothetical protein